jgi:cell division protein FtsZ
MAHELGFKLNRRGAMITNSFSNYPIQVNNSNQPKLSDSTQFNASIPKPVLKVLGLGGGGCNAINRMIELGLGGVDFIAANTDYQALQGSLAPVKIQLGPQVTRGLGAGGLPEIGYKAAEESREEIARVLSGAHMVFLAAGMGGGTGTGSISVAAEVAQSIGAVTVAIVTTPFSFEMGRRQKNATAGLQGLQPHTDTLIAIPNDRLLQVAPVNLQIEVTFRLADDVLRQSVQGITELITVPGLINVDFAHIRRLMKQGGGAIMSIGYGQGKEKAAAAIEQALNHPLLGSISIDDAAGIIANFTGGSDLCLFEVNEALTHLQAQTGAKADLVMGVIHDSRLHDRAQVILIVTGLGATALEDVFPSVETSTTSKQNNQADLELVESAPDPVPISMSPSNLNNIDIPAFLRRRRSQ